VIHILQGQLLQQTENTRSSATRAPEECFQQARTIARDQHAKMLELRAVSGLSRLWLQRGKRDAARDVLAPLYAWFAEGHDTADLQEARALLARLQT
jgi:predicted ATPase